MDPAAEIAASHAVPGLEDAVDVQAGDSFACALTAAREVLCWGANAAAAAVDASFNAPVPPTTYPVPGPATRLWVGGLSICVEVADGRVFCNGYNQSNSLGAFDAATTAYLFKPSPMLEVSKPEALRLATNVTCGLRDGGVHCLGPDFNRSPGYDGGPTGPLFAAYATPLPGRAKRLPTSGYGFATCATLESGDTHCWGNNAQGVADPTTDLGNTPPTRLAVDGADAIDLALGHGCAISDGVVRCWGGNSGGQLGPNATGSVRVAPTVVPLPARAAAIATLATSTCALLVTGEVQCWGANGQGQLGRAEGPADADATFPAPAPVKL